MTVRRKLLLAGFGIAAVLGGMLLDGYLRDTRDMPSQIGSPTPSVQSPDAAAPQLPVQSGRLDEGLEKDPATQPDADILRTLPVPMPDDEAEQYRDVDARGAAAGEALASALVDGNAPARGPTFDIVRVGPDGMTVVAGRTTPGSEVELRDGDQVIGRGRGDRRGEFVILPDTPLPGGTRHLSLRSGAAGGQQTEGKQTVVVARPGGGDGTSAGAAVVALDRDEVAPPRVMQRPDELSGKPAGPVDVAAPALAGTVDGAGEVLKIPSDRSTASQAKVSVDAVDYDTDGQVALSGRAAPGSPVAVYLDDEPMGQTSADEAGTWALKASKAIPPGRYRLRAARLDSQGQALAQVELPFERASDLPRLPPGDSVIVQPGNSLWRIARRVYGAGTRFTLIFDANQSQIEDPDLIFPGQVFSLPESESRL